MMFGDNLERWMFQITKRKKKSNKALKVECLLACDMNMQMDFTESILSRFELRTQLSYWLSLLNKLRNQLSSATIKQDFIVLIELQPILSRAHWITTNIKPCSLINTLGKCYELIQVLWLEYISTANVFIDLIFCGFFCVFI